MLQPKLLQDNNQIIIKNQSIITNNETLQLNMNTGVSRRAVYFTISINANKSRNEYVNNSIY